MFDVIREIVQHDFVLVRGEDRKIIGIVTAADISEQFRTLSEPFLLLGDIETALRRLIEIAFTVEELRTARDPTDATREVNSAADLGFGEYLRLLEKPENWDKLKLPLERSTVVKDLDRVGAIRNDVMHFDPDGIDDEHLDDLRRFGQFIDQVVSLGGLAKSTR